jgi:hypothetical protein
VVRNGTNQTNGTTGAYPSGVPVPGGYQWQKSLDYTYTWSDIPGATSQNYSPPAPTQTTYYRRIISGDYCTKADSNVILLISGGPAVEPVADCAGGTLSFFANPTGGAGSNTFVWSGPLSFSSTLQNPQILSASTANNGYYSVTVTDAAGCKNTKVIYVNYITCTYSIVLSASLLSFDAYKSGTTSIIKWETATEHNNDYFDVERSINGMNWVKIGRVKGAVNSSKLLFYTFIDQNPEQGVNLYRLKIHQTDERFDYSNIKKVLFDDGSKIRIVNIMPNPFDNAFKLSYTAPGNESISFRLMDAVGRIISMKESSTVKGTNTIEFDMEGFAKGLYFIDILYDGTNIKSKMIMKN